MLHWVIVNFLNSHFLQFNVWCKNENNNDNNDFMFLASVGAVVVILLPVWSNHTLYCPSCNVVVHYNLFSGIWGEVQWCMLEHRQLLLYGIQSLVIEYFMCGVKSFIKWSHISPFLPYVGSRKCGHNTLLLCCTFIGPLPHSASITVLLCYWEGNVIHTLTDVH